MGQQEEEELQKQEKIDYWLQRARDVKLDETCELFLTGDPYQQSYTHLSRVWPYLGTALFFGGGSIMQRFITRRPLRSGMHLHIFWSCLGLVVGHGVMKWRKFSLGENDIYFFYYMVTHPEDFPRKEKVLYNDFLTSWVPIR